jgi:uncharacterized protein (UPF0332 family)
MITPRDLINLANDLCEDDREVAWRTAASRAYYAAFHAAAQLLEQAGFEVSNSEQAHAYLWLCLENCGHADVQAAGMKLKDLRATRNLADYRRTSTFAHPFATGQVLAALGVLDLLESVQESPPTLARIADAIRVYERDVLRVVSYRGSP